MNRKMIARAVALGLTAAVTITSIPTGQVRAFASSYQDQIDDANDKVKDLQAKKDQLASKIKELEKDKSNVVVYIRKLDKQLEQLTDEITELNGEIDKVNADLKKTKKELKKAKETEENQYETMKKRIQYMYENGETSLMEVILSSNSISDMLNQVEYVSEIVDYDNNLLEEYKETKKQVAKMKKSLEETLEEKKVLNEELKMNQNAVEDMVEDKQKELKKYEANISDSKELSSEYEAEIARQEEEIEILLEKERKRIEEEERRRKEEEERRKQEQAANANSNSNTNSNANQPSSSGNSNVSASGFAWPVPGVSKITCGFGYRNAPTAGASTYHKGIDIGAPSGTTIVASKGGTVVTAAYSAAAGNYVMISHGNGVFTVYMHCSKLLVSANQKVSQGQAIALVGSTGISTGPHLHFAVSVGGTYVDPLQYVRP